MKLAALAYHNGKSAHGDSGDDAPVAVSRTFIRNSEASSNRVAPVAVYLTKSTVRFPLLYFAVQAAAERHRDTLPTVEVCKGGRVLRAFASEFVGTQNTADTARTLFPQLTAANHRWSGAEIGAGLRGTTEAESGSGILPGAAGLYTSLFSDALYNEVGWYSRYERIQNPFTGMDETTHWRYRKLADGRTEVDVRPPRNLPDALTGQTVFVYSLNSKVEFADFDTDSAAFQAWLKQLWSEPDVQRSLELASLESDYEPVNSVDYSTSRALGNYALRDCELPGLVVSTSRDDHPKTAATARNLVLTGPVGQPLSLLKPEGFLSPQTN